MNDTNVVALPASISFTPAQALASAGSLALTDVLIFGYEDGLLVVRSSRMTRAEAVFLLEKAKEWSMNGGEQ